MRVGESVQPGGRVGPVGDREGEIEGDPVVGEDVGGTGTQPAQMHLPFFQRHPE